MPPVVLRPGPAAARAAAASSRALAAVRAASSATLGSCSVSSACRAVRAAGMPLEITFAPTRINLHEAGQVIERAHSLGAFRFNSGRLMRIGTAARLWDRLESGEAEYAEFRRLLESASRRFAGEMELCFEPFEIRDGLKASLESPPATLLVLPNGWVKVAAALPQICADLRHDRLDNAWNAYRAAWQSDKVVSAARRVLEDDATLADANGWQARTARRIEIITEDP